MLEDQARNGQEVRQVRDVGALAHLGAMEVRCEFQRGIESTGQLHECTPLGWAQRRG
jgi:hypothetical protein